MPERSRKLILATLATFMLTLGQPVLAADKPAQLTEKVRRAIALFEQAKVLFEEGHTEAACEKMDESLQLDHGIALQYRLADCYESIGRLGSAYYHFNEAQQLAHSAGQSERARVAKKRAGVAWQDAAKVTVNLPDDKKSATIELAGRPARSGLALAVDKGVTTLRVTMGGKVVHEQQLTLQADGDSLTVDVPADAFPVAPPTEVVEVVEVADPVVEPEDSDSDGMDGQAIAGIVVGAAGVAAMGASVALGLVAKGNYDESEAHCSNLGCDETGIMIRDDARRTGDVATIVFAVGVVAAAGGTVLWLSAPSPNDAGDLTARLGVSIMPGAASLVGTW